MSVLGFLAVVGLVQLLLSAWQLQASGDRIAVARAALAAGDLDAARAEVDRAHSAARRAHWISVGPHLWAAEHLPVVGDDVDAVRTAASVGDEITGPVADDLFALRETLDPEAIRPVRGKVDLERFVAASGDAASASEALADLDDELAEAADADLVGPLATGVSRMSDQVAELRTTADLGAGVLDMLPEALGQDGPRRYLVVFQNNAELRASGGIPGSFAVLEARRGRLSLADEGTGVALFRPRLEPVLPLTPEERLLFGPKLGGIVADVNFTPDWSRSGALLRRMWAETHQGRIDGVLSVDPVALSYVLRGIGPIPLPDGKRATARGAVETLLNRPYLDYTSQDEQHAFFEGSTRKIFAALVHGDGDAARALSGLYDGVLESRALVWLTDPEEQARIADSLVAGDLSDGTDPRPEIGVYYNDATMTKLDYYLTSRTAVVREACLSGDRQRLRVSTTLTSHVPPNVRSLPYLLVGRRVTPIVGELYTTVLAYAPVGATVRGATLDGRTGEPSEYTHEGRPVVARTIAIRPGQTVTLTWTVETAAGQRGAPILRTTPLATTSGRGVVEPLGCA